MLASFSRPVDIVIPVYSGSAETLACLHSVIKSLPLLRTIAEIVVIFDDGPDLKLRDDLLALASQEKFRLLINEQNLGFVRTVNKGILRSDHDILLLNSDTLVANNWLDRMVKRAYASTNIATVTPFSNNAEICSWPLLCVNNNVYGSMPVSEIDQTFSKLNAPSISIPTAVGFCMFIKRECIDRIGVFDAETFGRGYGEENDFCMRAASLNYTHILASDVYVHHHGGVSFGKEKLALVENAIAKLDKLYPHYNALVARHIDEDPARKWRFAAELALHKMNGNPLILHISHGIGGGTDKHVVELSHYCSNQVNHAMLVPQADGMRLVFPGVVTGGLFEFSNKEINRLKNLLFSLSLSRVHVHHVQGWEKSIDQLLSSLDVPYDVTLHDYYFLHSNPALADKEGYFCESRQDRDAICAESIPFPAAYTAEGWRNKWRSLLKKAERIIAPSNAVASIYNSYHPELEIQTAYHPDFEQSAYYPPVKSSALSAERPLKVVVLGALSVIKGANLLEKVSRLAAKDQALLEFTLVGYAYKKLSATVNTLGPYLDDELPAILQQLKPDVIWFPCTWPETYSYTLSSALESGLPVIAPKLGSFPERLQNRPLTWLERWDMSADEWVQRLVKIRSELVGDGKESSWSQQPVTLFSYRNEYRQAGILPDISITDWNPLLANWQRELPEGSVINRRFYRTLIWLNSHRVFGTVANLVPFNLRRTVKRKLSTRPLHD